MMFSQFVPLPDTKMAMFMTVRVYFGAKIGILRKREKRKEKN
jgi:hypothetical protein